MTHSLAKNMLSGIKDSMKEEINDLQERADALEWESLEKILKSKGYDEKSIALEKGMFDSMKKINTILVKWAKKL